MKFSASIKFIFVAIPSLLVSTRKLEPLTLVEVENNGAFFDKGIIDSKMIDGRRFGATVSVVVIQDVFFAHRHNLTRVTDLTSTDTLQHVQVFAISNVHGIAGR